MIAPSQRLRDLRTRVAVPVAIVAALSAVVVGVAVAVDPFAGLVLIVAMVVLPAAVLKPTWVVYGLVVTVHAEAVTVGGYTVGRLAAPIALVAVVSQLLNAPTRLRDARLTLWLVTAYALWALTSMLWTVSVTESIVSVGSLAISIIYMLAFALIIRTEKDLRGLLWAVTWSSLGLAVIWIGQYLTGVDRRYSTVGDPNYFAAYQVITLPLVVVLLSTQTSALRRAFLYLAIAVIADSVITTLSRGGFGVLVVVLLLVGLLPWRVLFPSRREKAAFLVVCVIGLALLLPLTWAPLQERFQVGFKETNVAGDRQDLWLAAWNGYRQHPALGLGIGGFRGVTFQLLRVTPGVNLAAHARFFGEGEYVHNAYLESLAEVGPVGLALWLGILLSTGRSLRLAARRARGRDSPLVRQVANALLIGLVAFALASLLLSTETSRILWFLVGMSLALPGMAVAHRQAEHRRLQRV
jgi:O-antigen ligase